MILGDRLRLIRDGKQLSFEDVEARSGLSRAYLLRVENGHAVPTIEELEKWAQALEVPVHQLFYEGDEPPAFLNLRNGLSADDIVRAGLQKMASLLGRIH